MMIIKNNDFDMLLIPYIYIHLYIYIYSSLIILMRLHVVAYSEVISPEAAQTFLNVGPTIKNK